jgi:four helix bundle protein
MTSQIRRAALSVHLNVVEGCSRKSLSERRRFFEIARGSLIEIEAAFAISIELKYAKLENLQSLSSLLIRCFQMLSKMICK